MFTNFQVRSDEVEQISTENAMYLQKGDVVLVRSANVPNYGDHFIVVTGKPIQKQWGMRPQTIEFFTETAKEVLDNFLPYNGVVALKLKPSIKEAFHKLHGMCSRREEMK
jgi:hypothetical protein